MLTLGLGFLLPFFISPSGLGANARGIGIRADNDTIVSPWVVGALAAKAGISPAKSAPGEELFDLSEQYPSERPPDASELYPPLDL